MVNTITLTIMVINNMEYFKKVMEKLIIMVDGQELGSIIIG